MSDIVLGTGGKKFGIGGANTRVSRKGVSRRCAKLYLLP